jgi:hypothetical protein
MSVKKKIIAFSLWGSDPKYTIGSIKNALLSNTVYPGWICRFYVGKSVPKLILLNLKHIKNVEIVEMDEMGDWTGMFWRFYAASDNDVSVMISRDTDSRLTSREYEAVEEWLKSDKKFHLMRDHPYHSGHIILAGMWGVKNPFLRDIKTMIEKYTKGNFWQVDQHFLADKIFPRIRDSVMIHDAFSADNPFPTPRNNYEFVGQVYDENEETPSEHLAVLVKALEVMENEDR